MEGAYVSGNVLMALAEEIPPGKRTELVLKLGFSNDKLHGTSDEGIPTTLSVFSLLTEWKKHLPGHINERNELVRLLKEVGLLKLTHILTNEERGANELTSVHIFDLAGEITDIVKFGLALGFTLTELNQIEAHCRAGDKYGYVQDILQQWSDRQLPGNDEISQIDQIRGIMQAQDLPSQGTAGVIQTANEYEDTDLGRNKTSQEQIVMDDGEEKNGEKVDEEMTWTGRKIYKNLLLLSSSFLFIFTAFQALSNLQSSINCDEGLGLASLSTIYGTLIVSAMLVPSIMISYLGLKWTLVVSMTCYAVYTVANYYPVWATLIPASALVGFAAAPLWTAKSTYLTTIAGRYATLTGETDAAIINRFWGIFFVFFQSSQIIGNLISSLVLRQDLAGNGTSGYTCGAKDCYTETGDSNYTYCDPPDKSLTYTLLSVYLGSGIIAILIVAFLVDNIHASRKIRNQDACNLFLATTRLMKDYKLLLIIPLTIYSGLEQAFIVGDFTKSYVTCTLGVGWVGYIMISYGIADALFSGIFGRLAKYTGQIPLFCFGAITNAGLVVALFLWQPQDDELAVFFVIAALWGVVDAIWQTQLNALYGMLFSDQQESAYSNYRLWESVGFTISFAYSNFLCVWIKLTILICVLGVAMAGYIGVEILSRRKTDNVSFTNDQYDAGTNTTKM